MKSRIRYRGEPLGAAPVRPFLLLTVGLALLLAVPFVFLVPPGEAPDEPSHFSYLDHMLRHRSLPPVEREAASRSPLYEAFQPPLAYVAMAGALAMAGVERIDFRHRTDPDFAFQKNRRMFLPAPRALVKRSHPTAATPTGRRRRGPRRRAPAAARESAR